MPDTKITALTAIGANPIIPATFPIQMVDLTDTSMAASGTTKKVTVNQILGAGGTATLASATITGDLTAGGNVGFGTTNLTSVAGYNSLKINNATNGAIIDLAQGNAYKGRLVATASDFAFQTAGTIPIIMQVGGNNSYRIDTAGLFTWYDGAGGTRMTLNSTGLGVGVVPSTYKLEVGNGSVDARALFKSNNAFSIGVQNGASGIGGWIGSTGNNILTFSGNDGTMKVTISDPGNVGVGVTPSAWGAGAKAFEIGSLGSGISSGSTFGGTLYSTCNAYNDGSWKYARNVAASLYGMNNDKSFAWYQSSNSPSVGGAITFTQAMTLDASGNLLVGTTSVGGVNGITLQPSATTPTVVTVGSASTGGTAYLLYSTGASANRFYVTYAGTVFATNTTISAISDARFKENVQDIDVGLGAILALKPRKFDWKEGKGKDIKGDRGFIAQEFEQVFPQLVDDWADPAPEGEAPYKSVRQDLIPVLVKAIQELAARVQTLEAK